MRKLRRFFRHCNRVIHSLHQLKQAREKLKEHFGKDITVHFVSFGGEDINYMLKRNKQCFGIFRQCLLIQEKQSLQDLGPIQRKDTSKRIAKEQLAYAKGGEKSVTPRLLYAFDGGTVCEYLEGERLWDVVKKNPQQVWTILEQVIHVYHQLHLLGIAHLDATLKNVILDMQDQKIKIFDFEYYARSDISFELQQAYDFVRLIEHTLRIIPDEYQMEFESFIIQLKTMIFDDIKNVDFSLVQHYLKGIKEFPIYTMLKQEVFFNL